MQVAGARAEAERIVAKGNSEYERSVNEGRAEVENEFARAVGLPVKRLTLQTLAISGAA